MSNCTSYSGWTGTTGLDIIVHRNLFFSEDMNIHFEIDIEYISDSIPFPLIHEDMFKHIMPANEDSLLIHIPQVLLVPGCGVNIQDTSMTMSKFDVYDNVHQVHTCGTFHPISNLHVGFYKFN